MRFNFIKQYGITLVELMIALTLGIIVLGGGIQIFISGQQAYNEAQRFNGLQSDLSLIADLIASDVRAASSVVISEEDEGAIKKITLGSVTYTYLKEQKTLQRRFALNDETLSEIIEDVQFSCIPTSDCVNSFGIRTEVQIAGAPSISFQVGLRNRILANRFGS